MTEFVKSGIHCTNQMKTALSQKTSNLPIHQIRESPDAVQIDGEANKRK